MAPMISTALKPVMSNTENCIDHIIINTKFTKIFSKFSGMKKVENKCNKNGDCTASYTP